MLGMMTSWITLAKILFILVFIQVSPSACRGEASLATKDDIASLSRLLQERSTPGQGCAQQGGWQERVSTVEATLRSTEGTMNRLLDENAHLKASLSLVEEMVSQHSQLQDMRKRLSALEVSPKCVGDTSGCSAIEAAKPSKCSPPFSEVMGRCVFTDSTVSGLWEDMRQHCRDLGADMVVVDSADFMWHLVRHLEETHRDTVNYWVGAYRTSAGGIFQWVDGTPVKTGTPFWGHHNDFKGRQPYDNTVDLAICMWRKQFYFLHSCTNTHAQSVICQHK